MMKNSKLYLVEFKKNIPIKVKNYLNNYIIKNNIC